MAQKQTDTDPVAPPVHVGAATEAAARKDTDPGIAPPVALNLDPKRTIPMGVLSNTPAKGDSVDQLLEGLGSDKGQPQPQKTLGESAGKAAGSYQTKHEVHRGVPTPPPEEKVIVDVPKQSALPTLKLDRSHL